MARKQDWIIGGVILAAVALMFIVFVVLVFTLSTRSNVGLGSTGDKVAVIELNGIISSSRDMVRQFKRFGEDRGIKAIVFRINSPGGGIAASQEIYEHVRRVRDEGKPVVASMGSVAASGGYYVALGADTIMANPGTTTGSIGVIAEIPNFSGLLEKIGVSFNIIKSGKFKDLGTPYRDMTDEEREQLQDWIDSGYDQFVRVVAEERGMEGERVRQLADGRVYTGEQALELALIDTLGTFEDAVQLAADMAGIKGEPRLVRAKQRKVTLFDLLTSDLRILFCETFGPWPRAKYQLTW